MDNNRVRRPVRFADFLVVGAELVFNMMQVFTAATEDLLELSVYNANRKTELNKAWEAVSYTHLTLPTKRIV